MTAAARRELERHLAECRACEALYDSTRKTIRIVTDSDCFDLPNETSERVARELLAKLRSRDEAGEP